MFKFTILAVSLASLTLEATAAAIPRQQQTFFAESEPVAAVPGHLAIVKDDGSTKYLLANSDGTFDASPDAYTPILLTPNNNGTHCSMQINNSTSTTPACLQYLGSSQQPTALTGNCNNATMTYMFAYNSTSGDVKPDMGEQNTRRGLSTVALKFVSDSPKQQQAVSASNASMSSSASSASLSSMALSSASSVPSSSSVSASASTLSQMLAEAVPSSSSSASSYSSASIQPSLSPMVAQPQSSLGSSSVVASSSSSSASMPSISSVAAQAEQPTATTTVTVYVSSSSASASPSLLNAQAALSSSSILNPSASAVSSASSSLFTAQSASAASMSGSIASSSVMSSGVPQQTQA